MTACEPALLPDDSSGQKATPRARTPLQCLDFSSFLRLCLLISPGKVKQAFPPHHFPWRFAGQATHPASQLLPTRQVSLSMFTSVLQRSQASQRRGCQPRSTLLAGNPRHLCHDDRPGAVGPPPQGPPRRCKLRRGAASPSKASGAHKGPVCSVCPVGFISS